MTKVFGTEMLLITFVIIVAQCLILFHQSLVCLSRPNDGIARKFLFLILAYLQYNIVSGLFPDPNITVITIYWQTIIAYFAGVIFAVVYLNFVNDQYHLDLFNIIKVKYLLIMGAISYIGGFVVPYTLTGNARLSMYTFALMPSIVSGFFVYRIISQVITALKNKNKINKKLNQN